MSKNEMTQNLAAKNSCLNISKLYNMYEEYRQQLATYLLPTTAANKEKYNNGFNDKRMVKMYLGDFSTGP